MKKSEKDFVPKVASKSNAAVISCKSAATKRTGLVDNRPAAVTQQKIQQLISFTPRLASHIQLKEAAIVSGHAPLQRKILKNQNTKKVTKKAKVIDRINQSGFFAKLTTDAERAWARELSREDKIYTQAEAFSEIAERIKNNVPLPIIADKEDSQMRTLIEKHQSGRSRKQDRQVEGMHGLYENGTQAEKDEMIAFLKQPANSKGFTEAVRQGELNETLLTSDTPDAALRSLGAVLGCRTHADTTSGDHVYWTDFQKLTSYPTDYFIFRNTTTHDDGYEIQDTHINGNTFIFDAKGKLHLTVGATSHDYHLGDDDSLKSNYKESSSVVSLSRRNIKTHNRRLADRKHILTVKSSKRSNQRYKLKSGRVLELDKEDDLELFAEVGQIHKEKVLTDMHRQHKRLRPRGDESESEVSDYEGNEVELDANSEDEAEKRVKKRGKKRQKTS